MARDNAEGTDQAPTAIPQGYSDRSGDPNVVKDSGTTIERSDEEGIEPGRRPKDSRERGGESARDRDSLARPTQEKAPPPGEKRDTM